MSLMSRTCGIFLTDIEAVRLREGFEALGETFGDNYSVRVDVRKIVCFVLQRLLSSASGYEPTDTVGRFLRVSFLEASIELLAPALVAFKVPIKKYIDVDTRRFAFRVLNKVWNEYQLVTGEADSPIQSVGDLMFNTRHCSCGCASVPSNTCQCAALSKLAFILSVPTD
jgi:hypothetical protein